MEKKFKVYRCFSNNLKEFLLLRNIQYITVAKDSKTDKTFWLFIKDKELDSALKEWTNSKPR